MPITHLPHVRVVLRRDRKGDGVYVDDVRLPFVEHVSFDASAPDLVRVNVTLVGSVELDTDIARLVIKHGAKDLVAPEADPIIHG